MDRVSFSNLVKFGIVGIWVCVSLCVRGGWFHLDSWGHTHALGESFSDRVATLVFLLSFMSTALGKPGLTRLCGVCCLCSLSGSLGSLVRAHSCKPPLALCSLFSAGWMALSLGLDIE